MKLKKKIAVLLTATMVLGMTVTAFADNGNVPGGGSANGAGSSDGHVDRVIGNVILPTTVSANAFDYTIDPERLVKETTTGKDTSKSYTNDAKDKGVFFLTGTNQYDYKTNAYTVTNKSTFPIDVTVEVAASDATAETDIPLVSENGLTSATEASLYLGLKVGETAASATAEPVLGEAPAKKTVSVDSVPTNFETAAVSGNYIYREKSTASGWKSVEFLLEGETTNGYQGAEGLQITDGTTAPALTVTWKWKKYGEASRLSASSVSISSKSVNMTLPTGVTVSSVKLTLNGSDIALAAGNQYSVSGSTITFTKLASSWAGGTLTITFSDGVTETLSID
jgi:hypothetical protein